jgi:hypothetical protein
MTQDRPTITQAANGFWTGQQGERTQLPVTRGFVAPAPAEIVPVRRDAPIVPDWVGASPPAAQQTIDFQPGARESSSPMERAQALRVRLLPWVGVWAILSIIVGVVVIRVVGDLPVAGILALLIFAAMTAFTYYKMDSKDYEYSREGTERHKVDVVHDIALARMDHELEQKRLAFSFYLTLLDRTEKHD